MSDIRKAMEDLSFWYKVFIVFFVAYMLLSSISGMLLLREISVVSHCLPNDEDVFTSCYNGNK